MSLTTDKRNGLLTVMPPPMQHTIHLRALAEFMRVGTDDLNAQVHLVQQHFDQTNMYNPVDPNIKKEREDSLTIINKGLIQIGTAQRDWENNEIQKDRLHLLSRDMENLLSSPDPKAIEPTVDGLYIETKCKYS